VKEVNIEVNDIRKCRVFERTQKD